ncbi:MAG: GNAT family N-acetyltransferase [Firmicutes bacterium]|nr:GNAT family N-acetyltransferase [Bacillota bacterium]
MITYRTAAPADIRPAFDLALRVFMEFEAPDYGPEGTNSFRRDVEAKAENLDLYLSGKRLLFVALDGETVVGMAESNEAGHVAELFVDGAYHRRGIATELMNMSVCALKLRGCDRIGVNSSPHGLPFYLNYGFQPTDTEQRKDGFIFTPMEYIPNEIWDILDEDGNRTGCCIERGRKMAAGDCHLIVHVWKHNGKGEWLIDRRAPGRGTDIDGLWETTGGSVVAGEDSLTAALRETKEELGLDLDPSKGTLFHRFLRRGKNGNVWLCDAWVFEYDCPIEAVRLQEGETCDAQWASAGRICEMMAAGEFLNGWFYPYFEEMAETWGS